MDCALGETCFIQNYVDRDPSEGVSDHLCGQLSYDGHKGTDFRVPSNDDFGVSILAAAPGIVLGTRDGMADISADAEDAPDLEGRDCGNGLVIDHGGGWETQYCHLKNGSLKVQSGDQVARGQLLGEMGLSGRTVFPHLHMSVRRDGSVVDPFAPNADQSCGPSDTTLWNTELSYQPGGLMEIGISTRVPEFQEIKDGIPQRDTLPANAAAIVIWAFAFGSQPGDLLSMSITGPSGFKFEYDALLDRHQAQLYRAAGKRRPKEGWAPGGYQGQVTMRRNESVLSTYDISFDIAG